MVIPDQPLMVFQNPCNKLIKAAQLGASFVVPYKESVLHSDVASGKLIIASVAKHHSMLDKKCTSSRLFKKRSSSLPWYIVPKTVSEHQKGIGCSEQ